MGLLTGKHFDDHPHDDDLNPDDDDLNPDDGGNDNHDGEYEDSRRELTRVCSTTFAWVSLHT